MNRCSIVWRSLLMQKRYARPSLSSHFQYNAARGNPRQQPLNYHSACKSAQEITQDEETAVSVYSVFNPFSETTIDMDPNSNLFDDKWQKNFEKLEAYHRKHGHTFLARSNAKDEEEYNLACWLCNERKKVRLLQQGLPSPVTPHRKQCLDSLNVAYDVFAERWHAKAQEYQEWVSVHGIEQMRARNDSLFQWSHRQNRAYIRRLMGESTSSPKVLSDEQIAVLREINFHLIPCLHEPLTSIPEEWLETFRACQSYKKAEKHVGWYNRLPRDNRPLYEWLERERDEYSKWRAQEDSTRMTPHRAFLLESARLVDRQFETNFLRLVEHGFSIGYGFFPSQQHSQTLRMWMKQVVEQYKLRQEGRQEDVALTEEQIARLTRVGFDWEVFPELTKTPLWHCRFVNLKLFLDRYDRFPTEEENEELAYFVKDPLALFRCNNQAHLAKLNSTHIELLDSIGLVSGGEPRESPKRDVE